MNDFFPWFFDGLGTFFIGIILGSGATTLIFKQKSRNTIKGNGNIAIGGASGDVAGGNIIKHTHKEDK